MLVKAQHTILDDKKHALFVSALKEMKAALVNVSKVFNGWKSH